MTIEITPESLEAHADWIDGTGHGLEPGAALRSEAERIRLEQADEKRIDELAQVLLDSVRDAANKNIPNWIQSNAFTKDAYRAGVRAILAKLDEEKTPLPRVWGSLTEVPREVVEAVASTRLHAFRNEMTPYGWSWSIDGSPSVSLDGLTHAAPFTEIVGGAL